MTQTARIKCCGDYYAKELKKWARDFIWDGKELLRLDKHSGGVKSHINDNDVTQDIKIYLQSVGKFIKACNIVDFCGTPKMLEQLG